MTRTDVQNITITGLTKSYGGIKAVKSLDFEIKAGEFVSLLGPSGCGKTTTLRMIAGFVTPSSGSIFIGDREITHLPPYRRNVGLVFQTYALWPHMTVEENVSFGLRLRGERGSELKRKVEQALDTTNLSGLGGRYPRELSGGQQQRVALARSLVLDPPVLLMDEPLSNLDRKLRVLMRKELKELQQRLGMTTLYVTHDQDEAPSMSDRVAVMNAGRLERIAAPRELYDDPDVEFVADFVGSTNIFEGKATRRDDSGLRVVVAPGFELETPSFNDARDGETLKILVRPERIDLDRKPADGPNNFEGTIVFVDYHGPTVRYSVRLAEGREITVDQSDAQAMFSTGERVWINIPAIHLRRLRQSGG